MAPNNNDTHSFEPVEVVDIDIGFDEEDDDDEDEGGEGWLASYSDMMTDLMAIFVILFSFAMMNQSQQATIAQKAESALEEVQGEIAEGVGSGTGNYQLESEFDEIFELIRQEIDESGYSESIQLEKSDGFITFRFKDNVLFYPDSPVMRESSSGILQYMGDLLLSVDAGIDSIEISGFTANVGNSDPSNFFSWELSSDRAISVLKFFALTCNLPESKMFVSGYSHYRPIAGNDTEEDRSLNRRVEVKIVRTKASDVQILDK
ncbi:OmpA/MotB family protein [Scatolibacter rhodanostii]|uniref:OmpA/MotB family protein n=1 Tax=Scatolibacter rhodanostii TaxID=2014781 RepID=UPI000C086E8E|nr:flagellar motor protein MotB [Scatolibacter rhodanostii]